MTHALDRWWARAGYPERLGRVLEEIASSAHEVFGTDLISVLLGGSTSTGDFAHAVTAGAPRFSSDLDGLVVVRVHSARDALFQRKMAQIAAGHAGGLFYVDLSILDERQLRHILPTYQHAEMREVGVVLAGEDLRGRLPAGWPRRKVREAFFLNLWRSLLYRPAQLVDFDRRFAYAQALARQLLDLPFLIASEAGELVCGHRQRARFALPRLEALGFVPLARWIERAVEFRASGDLRCFDPDEVAPHVVDLIDAGFVLMTGGRAPAIDARLPGRLRRLMSPRSFRRIASEALRGPRDLRWLWRHKEALAASILVGMHVRRCRSCEPASEDALRCFLEAFSGCECREAELSTKWRELYWRGLLRLYPTLRKHDGRIQAVLRMTS